MFNIIIICCQGALHVMMGGLFLALMGVWISASIKGIIASR
jgi:hypothetical protein